MIDEKRLIEELNNTKLDIHLRTSMTPPQIVNATIEQHLEHAIDIINRQPQTDKDCSKCLDRGKCAIYDNFNIDYCSDWRME